MLKIDHEYTDFDNKQQVETLYFNLTKSELILDDKIQALEDQFRIVQALSAGPERKLTPDEIRLIFRLVIFTMSLSYGVRSEDGKRFNKKGVWEEFTTTAVYDSFVFSLFEDTTKAVSFIHGILPPEILAQAEEYAKQNEHPNLFDKDTETLVNYQGVVVGEVTSAVEDTKPLSNEVTDAVKDGRPAWIRENREPTRAELTAMSKDELLLALSQKNKP